MHLSILFNLILKICNFEYLLIIFYFILTENLLGTKCLYLREENKKLNMVFSFFRSKSVVVGSTPRENAAKEQFECF